MAPVTCTADGISLSVHLTPKSSCDAVIGLSDGPAGAAIRARVRAVPDKGRANAALVVLIARWLGVPKTSVSLVSGGKSRHKRLSVAGTPQVLIDAVNTRIAELS